MALHSKLQQILLLWVITAVILASSQVIPPDCQDKCGDVSITYPFGTKDGCYLNQDFLIYCNETFSPPKPLLILGDGHSIEVLNISIEGQLRVHTFVGKDCYNEQGNQTVDIYAFANLPRFPLSTTRNKLTAVGCDTIAMILDSNGSIITGCLSACDSIDSVSNGSCSGIGCCQISVPEGLFDYTVGVQSLYNHTKVWGFNPCSYTFLAEADSFNFSSADLRNLQNRIVVPTVIDWTVGNLTCEDAKNNMTSYACKVNSNCYDSNYGSGYRCNCSAGYEGNPYLPAGCQDINECADQSLNDCEKLEYCINLLVGSYNCSCPEGYNGDGRKDGEGCTPDQSVLVIKVTVGIGVGLIALLVCSSWLYWGFNKRRLMKLKEKFFRQNGGFMLQQRLSGRQGYNETAKIFTAEELEKATNNYDESRIIGRGGFGTVYKGILTDGKVIAIKKSKIVDQSQIEQFINEVVVLSQINHRNVVKLLGCCLETEVPLLVYEFISNGTLFEHIHDESKAFAMSWEIRLRIATETAGVLSYLHSATSTPIIHRDVKPTNILLDDNYIAKVSDFGASRLVPLDQAQLSTLVQGTLGYIDPEYFLTSQLTEKSDVYSFGVVLVELLTGKKALSFDRPEEERSLAMYFLSSLKEDRLFEVVENCVVNEGNIEQLKEVGNIARSCLRVKGEERPTMKEVAMELEGLRMTEKHPWVDIELNSEETKYLLGEPSNNFSQDFSANTTAGYDSSRNLVILPVRDGR